MLICVRPEVGYYLFEGPMDYALATWFLKAKCSKGNVADFFDNTCLQLIHNMLSFKSAKEWEQRLDNIQYWMPGEEWIYWKMAISTLLTQAGLMDHSIQY